MLAWSFFTVICLAAYTANLTAFFTDRSAIKPLKTIEDLSTSEHNITTFVEFQKLIQRNSILNHLSERNRIKFVTNSTHPTESEHGTIIKKIRNDLRSGNVLVTHDIYMDIIQAYEPDLYLLEGYFAEKTYHIAVRRKWKWKQINRMMKSYRSNGRFDFTVRKYKKQNHKDDLLASDPIGIEGFSGLLCTMSLALIVSILCAVFSYYQHRKPKICNNVTGN